MGTMIESQWDSGDPSVFACEVPGQVFGIYILMQVMLTSSKLKCECIQKLNQFLRQEMWNGND